MSESSTGPFKPDSANSSQGGGSPQLCYHDCSGRIPGHTTRAPPVGFGLETNGFQFYAIANTCASRYHGNSVLPQRSSRSPPIPHGESPESCLCKAIRQHDCQVVACPYDIGPIIIGHILASSSAGGRGSSAAALNVSQKLARTPTEQAGRRVG